MNLEPFHKILNKAMGLSPDSLGKSGIAHALKVRMRKTGCSESGYLKLLRSDEKEIDELVEEIVVPETWFFRDGRPFELLFETAFKKRRNEIRVLSAPCSTGEEPYSIAMTLLGAGCDPSRFRVDGIDISRRAIEKARNGIYSENSFRTPLPQYAENYFSRCEQGKLLAETIRKTVHFYTGNILEGCLPVARYDAIFCRNLLIYLDEHSKTCLAKALSEKLKDDGLLFVGHAELLPIFNEWFTPVRQQGTFALRKGKRTTPRLLEKNDCITAPCKPKKWNPKPTTPTASAPNRDIPLQDAKQPVKAGSPKEMKPDHMRIRELADRGLTGEALKMCDTIISTEGPTPELFHLCGLLHEAKDNFSKAEEYYGKALYLEPQHVESMVHLSLLLENKGERRKAELLKKRISKTQNR